jgi:hypothetical protein
MRLAVLFLATAPAFAAPVKFELALAIEMSRSLDFQELTLQS